MYINTTKNAYYLLPFFSTFETTPYFRFFFFYIRIEVIRRRHRKRYIGYLLNTLLPGEKSETYLQTWHI